MRLITWFLLVILSAFGTLPASAQTTIAESDSRDKLTGDVVMAADEMVYDEDVDTVIASGHVEITQGERVLLADHVRYRRVEGTVTASGDVALLEPGGKVLFADFVELTDDLRNGVIRRLGMLLTDNSRVVANGARRADGTRTVMRKAVFSPCKICLEDGDRAPLWQIRANTAVHDQAAREMIYYDASLDLFGVPVAYTPYFRHPDPTVKRHSGFLSPRYRDSTAFGLEVTTPYYWNIAPHRDATFSPRFISEEGIVLAGEYRERMRSGQIEIDTSITHTDKVEKGHDELRGHLFANGAFHIDPIWQWGFDLERALDDTYLRRYDISTEDDLTTNLFAEGYRRRSFWSGDAYWFQGLGKKDKDDQIPIVFPLLDATVVSEPNYGGGYVTADGNIMVLERLNGTDSRRISITGGWNRPFVSDSGHFFRLNASLRGDLYHADNPVDPVKPFGRTKTDVTGRVVPEIALKWRYPLVARVGATRQLVEPIVQAIASPYGGNSGDIPNEDSQRPEFDDTDLFSNNRFTGFDRVEGGPRVNYGVRLGHYDQGSERMTALFGQSARLKDDDTFDVGSGLDDRLSDYVGHIFVRPSSLMELAYRFRLDRSVFKTWSNEINLSAGPYWLRGELGYVGLEQQVKPSETTELSKRQVVLGATAKFLDYWTLSTGMRRDLEHRHTIHWRAGLSYRDECFLIDTRLTRSFTRDRDIEPDTTLIWTIQFQNMR